MGELFRWSLPVGSEGNLVPFVEGYYYPEPSQSEVVWKGSVTSGTSSGQINLGSVTTTDPFGAPGGSYSSSLTGAPYYYNSTYYNTYMVYDLIVDLITQSAGGPKIVKDGTPITVSAYLRSRQALETVFTVWDMTDPTRELRAKAHIVWASASEGAAVSSFTTTLAGTGSRAWYENIGSDGWIRVFCEVIIDTSVCEDLRAEFRPNDDFASVKGYAGSSYIWGTEAQYGSLNVTGEGDTAFANGGLYMAGGGIFDVETLVDVEHFRPIRRIPFASGHTYTSGILRQNRRRWRVTVRAVGHSRMQNIEEFFNIHNGFEHPFFFTLPITDDGVGDPWVATASNGHTTNKQETVTVYFSEDNLQVEEIGPSRYDVSFSVEELLSKTSYGQDI